MERVLLVGGAGFIGQSVSKILSNKGIEFQILDVSPNSPIGSIKMDRVSDNLDNALFEFAPTTIIHLAAQIDVRESFVNPILDLQVNILGTVRLLEAANEVKCRNFIYVASGGAIYDSGGILPHNEFSKQFPVSPYGVSKGAAEEYVRVMCTNFQSNWTSLAISNCYGPVLEHGRGVVYQFWQAITSGNSPKIYGPDVTRDFVYVDDVAEAIFLAISNPTNCRVNISSNTETSLVDLFKVVARTLESNVLPEIYDANAGEVSRSKLDNSLAEKKLGWRPKVDLEHGIRSALMRSRDKK